MTVVSLEDITKIYRDEIWKLHEVSQKVLSDRGPQFTSKFIENLTKALGIKQMLFIVYYPQTNNQMDKSIRKLKCFYNII